MAIPVYIDYEAIFATLKNGEPYHILCSSTAMVNTVARRLFRWKKLNIDHGTGENLKKVLITKKDKEVVLYVRDSLN